MNHEAPAAKINATGAIPLTSGEALMYPRVT